MDRRIIIGFLIVIAISAVATGAYFIFVPKSVPLAEVQSREIVETLVATGQVVPRNRTVVMAEVSATVDTVEVEAGDEVGEGDVLVQLDDEEGQLAADQAQAGVREARARLNSVVDQGAPTALQDLNQATTALEAAEEEYARARELLEAGVITRAEVDAARREVERARSAVESARAVSEQTSRDGSAYAEAAAMLARAEAEHELAQAQLENYTVRAPEDAVVLTREVEPGTAVQPGTVLVTLASEGPVDIVINPDEQELSDLEVGLPAIVVADAYPDAPFEAHIRRVDPAVDPEQGTISVVLEVDDPPDFIRTDMTVTVDIELDRHDDTLVVPRVAARDLSTDDPYVLRARSGRAVPVDVEVGLVDDEYVEILSGLESGDLVIAADNIDANDRIRTGPPYDEVRGGEP